MRMLLVGATGLTGRAVLALAADRAVQVTAVVRPGSPRALAGDVDVVVADPLDPLAMRDAAAGHEVVVCTVGQNRRTRSPWSALTSPPDTITRAARALASAGDAAGARVGVLVSAHGVADSRARTSPAFRFLVDHSRIATAFEDSAGAEDAVRAAVTPWVALRPTLLTSAKGSGWTPLVGTAGLRTSISRADLAAAVLDVAGAGHSSTLSVTGLSPRR